MPNKVAKGNYYQKKTKDWLIADGYEVGNCEQNQSIYIPAKEGTPARVVYKKHDLWGADLIAKNEEEMIFIQCKTNPGDIAAGIKELRATVWPPHVKLWVVIWEPRAKEPQIIDARG